MSITSEVIKLHNVRLSFANLFKAKAFSAEQDPKFQATFLLAELARLHPHSWTVSS